MSDMKCPVCKKEIRPLAIGWCCDCGMCGDEELWQELIRTRKALDAAIRGLDQMTWGCDSSDAEHLLKEIKEITALEQKE